MQFSSSFFHFFIIFLSFLLPVVELMKNDEKWWKMMENDKKWKENEKNEKKMKKKRGKLQFSKKWKIAIFLELFFIFFIFFHLFIIFYHVFIIFLSFLLPVVELMQNDKKWWKMMKKMKKWKKHDKKMKKTRKIVIFHFLENFCTTGSKNDETW